MFRIGMKPLAALFGMALLATAMSAQATVFKMESFEILENGSTYWLDEFSDGMPPADFTVQSPAVVDVNLYNRSYLVQGGGQMPGPEDGKLTLDTDQGEKSDLPDSR